MARARGKGLNIDLAAAINAIGAERQIEHIGHRRIMDCIIEKIGIRGVLDCAFKIWGKDEFLKDIAENLKATLSEAERRKLRYWLRRPKADSSSIPNLAGPTKAIYAFLRPTPAGRGRDNAL